MHTYAGNGAYVSAQGRELDWYLHGDSIRWHMTKEMDNGKIHFSLPPRYLVKHQWEKSIKIGR